MVPSRGRKLEVTLILLLAFSTSFFAIQISTPPVRGTSLTQWQTWAGIAWNYYLPSSQDTWDQNTGLTSDGYNWHYFTLWGLASNVFGMIAADRLGLNMGSCTNCPFATRVSLILNFLELSSTIDPSTGVPYLYFSTSSRLTQSTSDTNAADYGRLLAALFILNRYLLQKGGPTYTALSTELMNDVNKLNSAQGIKNMAANIYPDLYGYYVAQGFKLWGVNNEATLESQLLSTITNGPFENPSTMYGVSGIPSSIPITSELQINAVLEYNGIPQVTNTQTWTAFSGLASKIYQAQQNRYLQTNILTAWSEGAIGLPGGGLWSPGFVYEVISDGASQWVVRDSANPPNVLWSQANGPSPNNQPYCTSSAPCYNQYLPITYSKIGFGFLSAYGDTSYALALVNAVTSNLSSYYTYGFPEGLSETPGAPPDATWNVQTQDTILTAAAYQTLPLFTITATPTSAQIGVGQQAQYSISATFAPGFLETTTLSVIGLPAGTTGSFNPTSITPSGSGTGSSVLTVTAGSTTGTFYPVIQLLDNNPSSQNYGLTSVTSITLTISPPDFSISVNPTSVKINPGGTAKYTVTVTFIAGFSSPVTLSLSSNPSLSGATPSFSPNPITTSGGTSTLTITTTQSIPIAFYALTITGTGGSIVHTTSASLTIIVSVSMLNNLLLNAPANSVYFIFPDSNAAHKPPTVGPAQVTDWTALGFVYGSLNNMPQITALDTNSTYVNTSTGAPKISNSVIVLFGSRLVNSLVYYYETSGISPLYWAMTGTWSTGTEYYCTRSGQATPPCSGSVAASISIQVVGSLSQDIFLIEVFKDSFNNTVIIFAGFGWVGTFASGLYFKTVLLGILPTLTDSWYFYGWSDLNHNGFAEWYEVNPTPVNHGD